MNSSTTSTPFISNRFTFNNRRLLQSQELQSQEQQSPQQQQLPSTRFSFNQLRPSIPPITKTSTSSTSSSSSSSSIEHQSNQSNQSNITIDHIKNVYHLTKPLAMKNLRVTQKQMRGITKKYKIERWPYRKVNALETIYSFLLEEKERCTNDQHHHHHQNNQNQNHRETIDKVNKNIEKLEKMKNEIYNNPNEKYPVLKNKYRLLL
jgi:hypothetical protein